MSITPINEIKEAVTWGLKHLSRHCHNLRQEMQKDRELYCPQRQIAMKRILLEKVPEKETRMDQYMEIVKVFIGKYKIQITPSEYEMFVRSLGLVVNERICVSNNPEMHKLALHILS